MSTRKVLRFDRTECTLRFLRCWLLLLSLSYRTAACRSRYCQWKMGQMSTWFLLPHRNSVSILLSYWNILCDWTTWFRFTVFSVHSWLLLRNHWSHCPNWALWSWLLLSNNINSWLNNFETRSLQVHCRKLLCFRCFVSIAMCCWHLSTSRKTINMYRLSKRLLLSCGSFSSSDLRCRILLFRFDCNFTWNSVSSRLISTWYWKNFLSYLSRRQVLCRHCSDCPNWRLRSWILLRSLGLCQQPNCIKSRWKYLSIRIILSSRLWITNTLPSRIRLPNLRNYRYHQSSMLCRILLFKWCYNYYSHRSQSRWHNLSSWILLPSWIWLTNTMSTR